MYYYKKLNVPNLIIQALCWPSAERVILQGLHSVRRTDFCCRASKSETRESKPANLRSIKPGSTMWLNISVTRLKRTWLGSDMYYTEPKIFGEYALTTRHCIALNILFSYELRRCPIWKAPEWGQWVNVASDFVSPTPHNFLKRKLRVEVLARRFNLPEPIPTHKSPCLPRAKNYGSLLETVNNNQIRVQHTLLLGLSVYTP